MSTNKFVRNQSVHQQIVNFCMSASKEGSLGMSGSKFCLSKMAIISIIVKA